MTDSDKLKLVATVMIRRLSINSWTAADGTLMPPSFRGDVTGPVTKEDESVFANLKANDPTLHDQIWSDAAAILAALERGGS